MITIRNYNPNDYEQVAALYKQTDLFGGQFDEARDSADRLAKLVTSKPDAILVAESDEAGKIIGTVTLFEDGRSAWLYRFAVEKGEQEVAVTKMLWDKAKATLNQKGHTQVLVYAPVGDKGFEQRYTQLDFKKGNDFTAYWQDII